MTDEEKHAQAAALLHMLRLAPRAMIDPVAFARAYNELTPNKYYYRWAYSTRRISGRSYRIGRTRSTPHGMVCKLGSGRVGSVMAVVKRDREPLEAFYHCVERIEPGWWKGSVR